MNFSFSGAFRLVYSVHNTVGTEPMKKLTSILISSVIMLAIAVPAFAQQPGPGGKQGAGGKAGAPASGQRRQGGGMRMGGLHKMEESIFAKLGLSADQKAKLKALSDKEEKDNKAIMDKFRAMRESGKQPSDAERQKMRTQMESRRTAHEAALKKILTAAQYKKYQDLVKAEMEKMRKEFEKNGGRPGGPGAPGGPRGGGKPGGN